MTRVVVGLLLVAQGLDVGITWHTLQTGLVHEGNPIGAWVLQWGLSGLATAKALSTSSALVGLVLLHRWSPRAASGLLAVVTSAMLCVVALNLGVAGSLS